MRQKAEEISLKLNIEFILLNGWLDGFSKYVGLNWRTVSGESTDVTEEEIGAGIQECFHHF